MKKNLRTTLIGIVVLVMVITPMTIHLVSPFIRSEISADGILGYLANCIVAIPTIIIAIVAIWQTKESNEISERLLELEQDRQRLDLRPAFVIEHWDAPMRNFETTSILPEDLCIQIGKYSHGIAWGLRLTLLNISSGYETIIFNSAVAKDGAFTWKNSMSMATTRKIGLAPLEKKDIYFYADEEAFKSQLGKAIILDFYVKNRLGDTYKEQMEVYIMSMTDETPHREGEAYLYLEVQNYNVEFIEKNQTFYRHKKE